jgi:hypothetical protein
MPFRLTTSLVPALTTIPLVPGLPAEEMPAKSALLLIMMIDLLIVTGPKSPGSRTAISPPAIVLASAAAKVRHGDCRVHGLESLPNDAETQVCEDDDPPDSENVTDALSAAFIVTLQVAFVPLPLHAPPQLLMSQPTAGAALKVTPVPLA